MRYVVGLVCVLALGVMGCSETSGTGGSGGTDGDGGSGGTAGDGGSGGATGQEFPCTEQGIRDAIAEGGGPHTFDCGTGFPPDIVTEGEIVIDNDVILDGGGISVDGDEDHRVFSVTAGTTVVLRNLTVRNGAVRWPDSGGGIFNAGDLTLENCFLNWNAAMAEEANCPNFEGCPSYGGGIFNDEGGRLTLTNTGIDQNPYGDGIFSHGETIVTNSSVSDNGKEGTQKGSGISIGTSAGPNPSGGSLTLTNSSVAFNGFSGIANFGTPGVSVTNSLVSSNEAGGIDSLEGPITVVNSTVSENGGIGIRSASTLTATHITMTGNRELAILLNGGTAVLSAMLVDGTCMVDEGAEATRTSNGYNIESPGDTCGFDQETDLVDVSAQDLALGTREGNGGPTETHALLPGSVAIDVIPEEDCEVETDQRGEPRPDEMGIPFPPRCDVGAFERQRVSDFCEPFTNFEPACYPACEEVIEPGADPEVCADGLVSVAECLEDTDCTTYDCEAEWQAWAADCVGGP